MCSPANGSNDSEGARVGLLSNQSAVDRNLRHAIDVLHRAPGVELRRLFGPEHGLRGEAQDMEGVDSAIDHATGLPIISLYGENPESLRPRPEHFDGLDVLVFDVQDVGVRYYTFAATLYYAMDAASRANTAVLVLDRPNPIGGLAVEGPTVAPGFESFVGAHPIPIRHGMTVGELARLYRSDQNLDLELDVVPCEGWERGMFWRESGLPWVLPSPNMPTPETAIVYPGGCLIEGTNLSEGRGDDPAVRTLGGPLARSRRLAHPRVDRPPAGGRPPPLRLPTEVPEARRIDLPRRPAARPRPDHLLGAETLYTADPRSLPRRPRPLRLADRALRIRRRTAGDRPALRLGSRAIGDRGGRRLASNQPRRMARGLACILAIGRGSVPASARIRPVLLSGEPGTEEGSDLSSDVCLLSWISSRIDSK